MNLAPADSPYPGVAQVRQAEFHPVLPWVVAATKSNHVSVFDWKTKQVRSAKLSPPGAASPRPESPAPLPTTPLAPWRNILPKPAANKWLFATKWHIIYFM